MSRLLTRPTLAATSPARPESAKAASLPMDAPCPRQGRSERRGESYFVPYVEPLRVERTPLADFFSILLVKLYGKRFRAGSMYRQRASGPPCLRAHSLFFCMRLRLGGLTCWTCRF